MHIKLLMIMATVFCLSTTSVSAQTILVMGDSLSAAYNLRMQDGWVALLEEQLTPKVQDLTIINASISGETTQGGKARLPDLLKKYTPNIVILELGANDALRGYPLNTAKDNLNAMILQTSQIKAKLLLIGNRIPPNYGKRYANQFFGLYQELAEQHTLAYVPFMLQNVALDDALMQDDGLHPNKEGQRGVLQNIMPILLSMLSK